MQLLIRIICLYSSKFTEFINMLNLILVKIFPILKRVIRPRYLNKKDTNALWFKAK